MSDRASDGSFSILSCLLAAALLCRALVRLELDELFGDVVVVALGEDSQDGEARLVHVDAFTQRQPAGDAAFGGHVLQLQDGHTHGAVLPRETVVLHTHLQLIAFRAHLVTQGAAVGRIEELTTTSSVIIYSLIIKQPIVIKLTK